MRRSIAAILAASLLGGCFLDRGAIDPQNSSDVDGGTPATDGGSRDAGSRDASPPRVDSGPSCDAADDRCEGETAIVCEPAGLRAIDCPIAGAYCEAGACVPRACAPSAMECSGDGASVVTCDTRGAGTTGATACPRGCSAGACRPQTPCGSEIAATMGEGSMSLDLCGGGDDSDFADGPGCSSILEGNGEDRIVRLEVDRPGRYRIELADDSEHAVDAAVYVRSACAERSSELGCANGGAGVSLDASLEIELPAGDYFVILDSLDYGVGTFATRCGRVRLTISRL